MSAENKTSAGSNIISRLYHKGIITGIFAILFLGSIIWSVVQGFNQKDRERRIKAEATNVAYESAVAGYEIRFDTLISQQKQLKSQLFSLLTAYEEGKARETKIVNTYTSVYEKINRSSSAAQRVADTKELLAKHARLPFDRN